MDSKDTPLEEQARKEAYERYPTQPWEKEEDRALFEELNAMAQREQAAYAAGLIAARQQNQATIAALRAEVEGLKDELLARDEADAGEDI